ncbi:LOW QUALITY PROTEIN: hypothetical protein HID58_050236 [Brassica napus]|uniref:Glycosyltransferase n=1 Tax=Brassica napus TaxID=3708 RepID=A0ABQ8A5J0_BRANA|nr:LOW QUALITY PROTEIN: hypothetical protein HID58_050236 [Brassica napus]
MKPTQEAPLKKEVSMEKNNSLRVILFPLPLQGCIIPMLSSPRYSYKPSSLHLLTDFRRLTETRTRDVTLLLTLLNKRCESPFHDCVTKPLQYADEEEKKQSICCLIHDSNCQEPESSKIGPKYHESLLLKEPFCSSFTSNQPFLLVVRVGLVNGTRWTESMPKDIVGKGRIVKWAPLQVVLNHRAVGFLTHGGWNSTVESVPMICLPFIWDQMLNARFVSEIWVVGMHLEGQIERNEIERAVRRLILETEGEAIREKMEFLKEKVLRSVKENGSAYRSLEYLILIRYHLSINYECLLLLHKKNECLLLFFFFCILTCYSTNHI